MSNIYRRPALDKLQSPEQLDKMIQITSPMFWIAAAGGGLILTAAIIWSVFARLPINVSSEGILIGTGGVGTVYSDAEGIVDEVLVSEGDTISKGQVVARLTSPAEEKGAGSPEPGTEIKSTISGRVVEITVAEGNAVTGGSVICQVSRKGMEDDMSILCYVPVTEGRKIREGMSVAVYPSTVNIQEYGHMNAVVSRVDEYVTSREDIRNTLADGSLVEVFTGKGPVVCVECELEKDPSTVSGYKWSSNKGASVALDSGTMVNVDIVTQEKAPIIMLFPLLREKTSVQREN